jgi:cytoskeletal protein RodZ
MLDNVIEQTEENLLSMVQICTKLKEERNYLKIPLEDAEEKTKISRTYLEAIEDARIEDLPFANIYKKNFIKKYANYLGLDLGNQISQIILVNEQHQTTYDTKTNFTYKIPNLPRILKIIAISIVLLAFVSYLGIQIQNILKPPALAVYAPENGEITQNMTTEVRGKTAPEIEVSINGKEIKSQENGEFNETVNLNVGLNTITVTAKKKYGKLTSETRYVILKKNQELFYKE